MFLSVGPDPLFRQGDEITVTYNFTREPAQGQKVRLYRKTEFDRDTRRAAREKDREGQGDTLIKSWNPVIGQKHAFKVTEKLPPGSYAIRFFTDPQKLRHHSAHADFSVIAPIDAAVLDVGKTEFLWNETIPVRITLPEGQDASDPFLFLQLERQGGYAPGCSIRDHQIIFAEPLDGQLQHDLKYKETFSTDAPPGSYVLTLRRGKYQKSDGSPVIGRVAFDIVAKRFTNAIEVATSKTYTPGDTMDVPLTAPASVPPEALSDTELRLNFLGYNAPGGSVLQARITGPQIDIPWNSNRATVPFQVPDQGYWEFWLVKDRDAEVVLDKIPFVAKDPSSPFEPEYGVGSGKPRYNLARHHPFPPLGEYLDPETCGGPFEMEPAKEEMELSFVKWSPDGYVPLDGPVEFGQGFYVQGKLEDAAQQDSYIITVSTPEGDRQEVTLYPLKEDPTVVRSDRVYLIWHPEEGGDRQ